MEKTIESLKYPIGKFNASTAITPEQIEEWINEISFLPNKIRLATLGLSDQQLNMPYRPGGWTIRQVVHHLADSHMNAYIRFKLAVTEEDPIIKPYYEDRWAECLDARSAEISFSVNLLESLHNRWVVFMKLLRPDELKKCYIHPEHGKTFSLESVIGLYAWHGKHHLQHILQTVEVES